MWQKERELKELRESAECAPRWRRQIVESVSNIERRFARRYNHGAKPKPPGKEACGTENEHLIYQIIVSDLSPAYGKRT